MRKHVRIFVAGALAVIPFAVTAYLAYWAGALMIRLGGAILPPPLKQWLSPAIGVVILLVGVYLVGLLMHWWAFRWLLALLERVMVRLPIARTIYESVRDLLKLFGGDARQMGQVVRYRLPGTNADLLGIQTTTSPRGAPGGGKVAVYLPLSYMVGGITVYVAPEAVEPVDISVEEALKLAATAEVGVTGDTDDPAAPA